MAVTNYRGLELSKSEIDQIRWHEKQIAAIERAARARANTREWYDALSDEDKDALANEVARIVENAPDPVSLATHGVVGAIFTPAGLTLARYSASVQSGQ